MSELAKLTREQIEALRERGTSQTLQPDSFDADEINMLCDMALSALSGVRVPEETVEFIVARLMDSCEYCSGRELICRNVSECTASKLKTLLAARKDRP